MTAKEISKLEKDVHFKNSETDQAHVAIMLILK